MGVVGFGAYRISHRSSEHKEALELALKSGCRIVDTSANYTNGESEELIGQVLAENKELNVEIITKAGYIQGNNLFVLEELNAQGKALDELVEIRPELKHSIHPDFLEDQITRSLKRLGVQKIDFFLLHNPEYYLETQGATQEIYYQRIQKAFNFLEKEVAKGRIKAYGISSNNFILELNNPKVTDLNKVIKVAQEINAKHFKMVQFPFNLIEIGALEKEDGFGHESVIDLCQKHGILSVGNRPLNAFSNNKLIRLATYENDYRDLNDDEARDHFNMCMEILRTKWAEHSDVLVTEEDFDEIEILKQFRDLWNKLKTPDAVDQVYMNHFFPFLARVWGGSGLSAKEAEPFYALYDISQKYARKHLSADAIAFKSQAKMFGLLPESNTQDFAVECIETYLDYGLDFVLVGMKRAEYVISLKHLF